MRYKDESKFELISREIKRFIIVNEVLPTQRELALQVGLSKSAVFSYLKTMKEKGLIAGIGRRIVTPDIQLIPMPFVECLADSRHTYETANVEDYIFISRKPFGAGDFGGVYVIDNSMQFASICPKNKVLVRSQKTAENGQIVLAKTKTNGFVLRRYTFDKLLQKYVLVAESVDEYPLIYDFEIRGVAVQIIKDL